MDTQNVSNTGWANVCTLQPVVQPFVRPAVKCIRAYNVQIPLDGPDQTVGYPGLRSGLRQVRGLCLVASGSVRVYEVEFGTNRSLSLLWVIIGLSEISA